MCAGTKQPYKSVRKGNKMIFSTITQNNLNLTADTTEIPAQYSNNIQFKFIQDNERFSGYIPTIYIGVYDSAMIECGDVISAGGAVVVDGDGVFAISNEIMYRNGFLAVGVTLTNNDENVSLKPVIYRIQASIGGLSPLPPDEGEWQQVVKAFVETLFNNWSIENLDPIKAQLEELISTAQTQQEKITSQQTQIDNAIGNMGDYEIVQEDPVQIRFKKGDGTFGETVDLGDGLASKAMVNAGYYTYKGISYGGSASNNGIDVAEIDGAYSQGTTNGYQLFDASKLPTKSAGGATVTNNGDGSFTISGSGNLTDNFIYYYNYSHEETLNLLKAGNISLRNGATTNPRFLVQLKTKDDTTSSTTLLQLENNEIDPITQEMLNNPDTFLRIFFFGLNGSAIQAGTIKPMLYQDGDGTWEPFTDGIASPNPEYPQEPKFVGDYNEDTQKYDIDFMTSGKNLLNITSTGGTKNGITYTINDDKSVTLNGATTDTVSQLILNIMTIPNGTYCLNGTNTANVYMRIWSETQQKEIYKSVNSGSFEITNNDVCQIQIYIHRGVTSNNVIIYPQLELGSTATSYEPFTGFETTTVELNQPLRALPNGAKDTIENGSVIRHICEKTINNTTTIRYLDNLDLEKTIVFNIVVDKPLSNIMLCNNFLTNTKGYLILSNTDVEMIQIYTDGNIYIRINKSRLNENNLAGFKTWLQSNPVTVWYELATPTTEQITLPTLPSWYPYTNAWVGTELQPSFVEWHIKIAGVNQNDLTVIKEDISQLQTETTQLNDDVTKLMGAFTSVTDLTKQLFLLMHRVGDIIFSTSDENPSTIYGGTWVAWGKGQVPVGVDTSDSDFNTVEKTGGEKEHTLTVDETPSHKHDIYGGTTTTTNTLTTPNSNGWIPLLGGMTYKNDGTMTTVGNDEPHNNLQPYITCYMWKRIA